MLRIKDKECLKIIFSVFVNIQMTRIDFDHNKVWAQSLYNLIMQFVHNVIWPTLNQRLFWVFFQLANFEYQTRTEVTIFFYIVKLCTLLNRYTPLHICVYTHVCVMCIHVLFFVTFPHFECERGYNSFDPKKITVFSGTKKVGPICPTFIRGYPYEPHRPPEKVTFSDH